MKYKLLLFLLSVILLSCSSKPTVKNVRKFNMSKYCDDFYVLAYPNNLTFVLINRKNPKIRLCIYKCLNTTFGKGVGYYYNNSEYGMDNAEKNFAETADEALEKALKFNDGTWTNVLYGNIFPAGSEKKWIDQSTTLINICVK